ncbi:MAG: FAD-dependent oxidoreductase [Bryobacterales bacterium]
MRAWTSSCSSRATTWAACSPAARANPTSASARCSAALRSSGYRRIRSRSTKSAGNATRSPGTSSRTSAKRFCAEMLQQAGVRVLYRHRLREKGGVRKQGLRVAAITTEDGTEFQGQIFADCSYEGDLMAQAGVSYTWGRESTAELRRIARRSARPDAEAPVAGRRLTLRLGGKAAA